MKDSSKSFEALSKVSTHTGGLLAEMFRLLHECFGPQNWWPAETALEVMVGAVLTQNTNWNNVQKAIDNIKAGNLMSLEGLHSISKEVLAERIRPAGYYNIKAERLKNLVSFILDSCEGDFSLLHERTDQDLREAFLSIKGIGPETADSILLYALGRPVFVVDSYTHRILNRHGMVEEQVTYLELKEFFEDHLPEDRDLYNEFHALIVMTGKDFCRKKPLCDRCPLEKWGHVSAFR